MSIRILGTIAPFLALVQGPDGQETLRVGDALEGERIVAIRRMCIDTASRTLCQKNLPSVTVSSLSEMHEDKAVTVVTIDARLRDHLTGRALPDMLKAAGVEPAPRGFRIYEMEGPWLRLGLQNEDVITHINDTALTDAARTLALLGSLRGASEVEVRLEREGVPKVVRYRFK